MFSRHSLPLAVAGCLLLASAAAAAPEDTFTATSAPSRVKPSTSATYTVTLKTNTASSVRADRATIPIPSGFAVTQNTVNASTSAAGACVASEWEPNVNSERIRLDDPGGANRRLCPGATLTVVFQATSPATEGSFSWNPSLRGENDEEEDVDFTLSGPPPTIVVDGTSPTATISQKPLNPSNSRSGGFAFTVDEPAATTCRLDSGGFLPCNSPVSYTSLADGPHTFTLRATDAAGNAGNVSYTWTVDVTPPVVTILQKPLDPSNTSSASFAFIVSESSSMTCKLDSGEFSPCNSPVSYSNLPDGSHTFTLRGTDAAGNTGETSYSWRVETRSPSAAIASGPAALSNSRSATFTFSADEPSSFECQLDSGGFHPCSSPATYDGLGDGAHTFAVRPTDAVGNTGAASSHSWTIDATAPETTLGSAPRSGTTTASASFTFSASEPGSFECKLDAGAFAACTSPQSYARLNRGAHSFEVRAIDAAGNVDPAAARHGWTIVAPKRVKVTSALFAPRAGARVTSPPLLAWRRAPRATYYNVQLFRGGVKVLSTWPVRTRLQLRSRWTYLGRKRRLAAGRYRWYVWPGYGRAAANRYGRLLGQSTFTVVVPGR